MMVAGGWALLRTQHQQGAVRRGLDFAAFRSGAGGVELVLVEAKSTAGLVSPRRFTSLGLGRGGPRIWEENLGFVGRAIEAQVTERATQLELLRALDRNASIRLVGPTGFRVTDRTLDLIEATTERAVSIWILSSP